MLLLMLPFPDTKMHGSWLAVSSAEHNSEGYPGLSFNTNPCTWQTFDLYLDIRSTHDKESRPPVLGWHLSMQITNP